MAHYLLDEIHNPRSRGFRREVASDLRSIKGYRSPVNFFHSSKRSFGSSFASYRQSGVHQAGMSWVKDMYGIGRTGFNRIMGLGFTGLSFYQGYKEGGFGGGIKQVAQDTAFAYGARAAIGAVGVPVAAITGGVLGAMAGFGAMRMMAQGESPLEAFTKAGTRDFMRKNARLELGGAISDPYGNIATMRQRSVNAIMNSRLNGRTALGQEAALAYRPYFS